MALGKTSAEESQCHGPILRRKQLHQLPALRMTSGEATEGLAGGVTNLTFQASWPVALNFLSLGRGGGRGTVRSIDGGRCVCVCFPSCVVSVLRFSPNGHVVRYK